MSTCNGGGFPEVVLTQNLETKRHILKSYLEIMLLRDVVEKNRIQNVPLVDAVFKKCISSYTKQISVHRWYNDIKSRGYRSGKDTVYLYLKYLEETGFILFLDPLKNSGTGFRKIYLADNGLTAAASQFTMDSGKQFENRVFLDLLSRKEPVYYCGNESGELDFITRDSMIQACLSITRENYKREIRGFSLFSGLSSQKKTNR